MHVSIIKLLLLLSNLVVKANDRICSNQCDYSKSIKHTSFGVNQTFYFRKLIGLKSGLGGKGMHCIKINTIQQKSLVKATSGLQRMVIYPVDREIHHSN